MMKTLCKISVLRSDVAVRVHSLTIHFVPGRATLEIILVVLRAGLVFSSFQHGQGVLNCNVHAVRITKAVRIDRDAHGILVILELGQVVTIINDRGPTALVVLVSCR